jgi:hypothetical protein
VTGGRAASAHLPHRQAGGPVRPDDQGELGDELGHVQADLQVAGCYVAVAGVEQHGLAVAGEQDAVRGQAPVRDLAGVQPADRIPDLAELGSRRLASAMSVSTPAMVALAVTPATASTTISMQDKAQRTRSTGLRMRRSS